MTAKPQYRVPLVSELDQLERNGLNVVSTFSGCGGSSLGFRMSGFTSVSASEFNETARGSYAANLPGVPIDGRDIREVTGDDIREATGLEEFDVLEGSPPCQPFSMSGSRNMMKDARDCVPEFVRLLNDLRPRAFTFENVKGLVMGRAKGYYLRLMAELAASGYRGDARILDAQWLGVPQRRQRLFIIGYREDLELVPSFPHPLPYRYSIRDAIGDILRVEHSGGYGATKGLQHDGGDPAPTVMAEGMATGVDEPLPTVQASQPGKMWARVTGRALHHSFAHGEDATSYDDPMPTIMTGDRQLKMDTDGERRRFTIPEVRRLCGFPDDFELLGNYAAQWSQLGNAVPPPMSAAVARAVAGPLLA